MHPKPSKLSFDELAGGIVPFLHFPNIESEIKNEKRRLIREAERTVATSESYESLERLMYILDTNTTSEYKNKLQLILATTIDGSLEALDRICMIICPDHRTWARRFHSKEATRTIVNFLVNPDLYEAIPWFTAERFRLPSDWHNRMRGNMSKGIHKRLQPLYGTKIGLALEGVIRKAIIGAGYGCEKGFVSCVDEKEVDAVVPEIRRPRVLIMSSYSLTTSSAQSQRAREQKSMYEGIRRHNSARVHYDEPDIQLVNVIDGGGWIARSSDLKIMHQHCDYALAVNQLHLLPDILQHHMSLA